MYLLPERIILTIYIKNKNVYKKIKIKKKNKFRLIKNLHL